MVTSKTSAAWMGRGNAAEDVNDEHVEARQGGESAGEATLGGLATG